MAAGETGKAAGASAGGTIVHPCSVRGSWVTVNNATTAQASGDFLNPLGIDDDGFRWIEVNGATRILIRARCDDGYSAVSTSPVVQVFGVFGPDNLDPAGGNQDGLTSLRLDSNAQTGGGLTTTFPASPMSSNTLTDGTYFYSLPVDLDGVDLKGCAWVGVPVATAFSGTGSGAVEIQALLIN